MATNLPRSYKDITSVIFSDADGANEVSLTLENGDINITWPDTHEHVADRGGYGNIIDGNVQPMTVTMSVQVKEFTGSAGVLDAVTCTASGWDFDVMDTSSGDYSGLTLASGTDTLAAVDTSVGVFQMRAVVTDPGDGSTQTLYFANCRCSPSFTEGMPSNFTLNITSYMSAPAFMSNIA
jgi:hypothetical protein